MRRFLASIALVGLCCGSLTCGCRQDHRQSVDCAQKFGLHQSRKSAFRIESAIFYANAMLAPEVRFRLTVTWPNSLLTPRYAFVGDRRSGRVVTTSYHVDKATTKPGINTNVLVFHNAIPVPVYLIDDDALASTENVFVPDGTECIFVNVRKLDQIYGEFGLAELIRLQGGSILQQTMAVSLILLHEIGHLHYGDQGSYTTPAAFSERDLMLTGNSIQNKEVRADRFAIEQVRRFEKGSVKSFSDEVWGMSGAWIAGDILRTVKQAVSEHEFANDPFGVFDQRPKPKVFSGASYSHPNLYLRFYVMDLLLDPDESRKTALARLGVLTPG